MRTRPITMVKVTHGYNLFVNNVPFVSGIKGGSEYSEYFASLGGKQK